MERDSKRCTVCGESRPLTEFYAGKGGRDGLRGDCKRCFAARAATRYREHPDKGETARVEVAAREPGAVPR